MLTSIELDAENVSHRVIQRIIEHGSVCVHAEQGVAPGIAQCEDADQRDWVGEGKCWPEEHSDHEGLHDFCVGLRWLRQQDNGEG